MLILKENIKLLYFVHIPRTGGRYIRDLFWNNNFLLDFHDFREYFMNKEIPHLHYPLYNIFTNYGEIPQFTIVRNPLNRFISMFFSSMKKDNSNLNIDEIFKNERSFEKFISNQLTTLNFNTNWFRPQKYFINENCKIWKYEDGFEINFCKWLLKNFNIEIKNKKFNYKKSCIDDYKKVEFSKKNISLIKNYYKEDFKIFEYK